MRFAGIGLLVIAVAVAVLGGLGAGDAGAALIAVVVAGFLLVTGAIFTAGAVLRETIERCR